MRIFTKSFLNAPKLGIFILCLCAFSVSYAQEQLKIGYISSERIMRDSTPTKAADAKLKAEFSKREKDLQDMQARLKAMSDKLEKDMPVLTESDRIKRQREVGDYGQDYQNKMRRFREDLVQRRNEELTAAMERINKAIKEIGEKEKYDLIIQDPVFWSPRIDITDKVLKAVAGSAGNTGGSPSGK